MKKKLLTILLLFTTVVGLLSLGSTPLLAELPSDGSGASSGSPIDTDVTAGCSSEEINTAFGCIPYGSPNEIAAYVLGWALGIAGGVAFLLIIVAGFQIMTSQGNPDKLQGGQQLLGAAIAGLVMIIFSAAILRILGVNILGVF